MQKIIMDTNVLLAIYQFKVDVFSELAAAMDTTYQLFVIDATIAELEKLAEKRDKAGRAAKLGLIMIQEKGISKVSTAQNKDADTLILETAKAGYSVVTQDRELKSRLKKAGIPVITLRQKQYFK